MPKLPDFLSNAKKPLPLDAFIPRDVKAVEESLVVNSKQVLKNEVVLGDGNACAKMVPAVQQIRLGDVVINGTGVGTIGRAAAYLHNIPAAPDNHVTILRIKNEAVDPVYLSVYLNSIAGQIQVNKWLHGSSGQTELYPGDIAQFQIWLAPRKTQATIRKKVEDAFKARNEAQVLLARAQRAVEIAIEEGEAAGMRELNPPATGKRQPRREPADEQ